MTALAVLPGRNVWIWARSDSDAPSAGDVRLGAAQTMLRALPDTGWIVPPAAPGTPDDLDRYYLGPARPLDVTASQTRPMPPKAAQKWTREEQARPYAVKADRPWWALVDFDWRGPRTQLTSWPAYGPTVANPDPMQLQWLLMWAGHVSDQPSRPDSSWTGDVIDTARGALERGTSVAVGSIVLLGAAWILLNSRRR